MAEDGKVFISYAHEDYEIAKKLHDDLKQKGVDPWLDKVELRIGENWKVVIREAIKKSTYFLALISSNSVSKRGFVQKELKWALEIYDEIPSGEIFLLPIRLDDTKPIDERLQDLHWGDLSGSYEEGFNQILRVLKPEGITQEKTKQITPKTTTKKKKANSLKKSEPKPDSGKSAKKGDKVIDQNLYINIKSRNVKDNTNRKSLSRKPYNPARHLLKKVTIWFLIICTFIGFGGSVIYIMDKNTHPSQKDNFSSSHTEIVTQDINPVQKPSLPPSIIAEINNGMPTSSGPEIFELTIRSNVLAGNDMVYIDGKQKKSTPIFWEKLPAGKHTIRIEAEGYVTFTREIDLQTDYKFWAEMAHDSSLKKSTELSILEADSTPLDANETSLDHEVFSLTLLSPERYTVYIDGVEAGSTPCTIELPAGKHTIKIIAADHYPLEKYINLKKNEVHWVTMEDDSPLLNHPIGAKDTDSDDSIPSINEKINLLIEGVTNIEGSGWLASDFFDPQHTLGVYISDEALRTGKPVLIFQDTENIYRYNKTGIPQNCIAKISPGHKLESNSSTAPFPVYKRFSQNGIIIYGIVWVDDAIHEKTKDKEHVTKPTLSEGLISEPYKGNVAEQLEFYFLIDREKLAHLLDLFRYMEGKVDNSDSQKVVYAFIHICEIITGKPINEREILSDYINRIFDLPYRKKSSPLNYSITEMLQKMQSEEFRKRFIKYIRKKLEYLYSIAEGEIVRLEWDESSMFWVNTHARQKDWCVQTKDGSKFCWIPYDYLPQTEEIFFNSFYAQYGSAISMAVTNVFTD